MKYTFGRIPFNTNGLGSLRTDREDNCGCIQPTHIFDRKVLAISDGDVPKIMDVLLLEKLPVLLLESATEFQLRGEYSIFSQPAEFDITVEYNDFVAGFRKCAGNSHTSRSRSHHDNDMRLCSAHTVFLKKLSKEKTWNINGSR